MKYELRSINNIGPYDGYGLRLPGPPTVVEADSYTISLRLLDDGVGPIINAQADFMKDGQKIAMHRSFDSITAAEKDPNAMHKFIISTGRTTFPNNALNPPAGLVGRRDGVPELLTVYADSYEIEIRESKKGGFAELLHFIVGDKKVASFKQFQSVQREVEEPQAAGIVKKSKIKEAA